MINQDELLAKYDDKSSNYFLLDVRSPLEFADHRLPGAVNVPIDQLESRLGEIPKEKHIITICEHGVRSGTCEAFLNKKGYHTDSLQGGLSLWKGQLESSN